MTIVSDTQVVASLTIVIVTTLGVSFILLESSTLRLDNISDLISFVNLLPA
jgi:hypothetical protein